jgi:hypothetical protein
LICASAIGYVWQKNEIVRLGRQISERERHLLQIERDNQSLADQLAILHSPLMLDRRVQELNLGLGPAQPMQVVRLSEVPAAVQENESQPRKLAQMSVDEMTR